MFSDNFDWLIQYENFILPKTIVHYTIIINYLNELNVK